MAAAIVCVLILLGIHTGSARAQDRDAIAEFIKSQVNIRDAVEEMVLHHGGMTRCKLGEIIPQDDLNMIATIYHLADPEAMQDGTQIAIAIMKRFNMRPGSKDCREIAAAIRKAVPTYKAYAAMIRAMGY